MTDYRGSERRRQRSRQAIVTTFTALWPDVGYEDLTVKGLVEQAGVGYATFYRHFRNMDDLLLTVTAARVEELSALIDQQETLADEVVGLFAWVEENERFFRAYDALPFDHLATELLSDFLDRFLLERYEERPTGRVPITVTAKLWTAATLLMLRYHLDDTDGYTAEQLAELHIELTLKALESTAIVLRNDWLEAHPRYLTDR